MQDEDLKKFPLQYTAFKIKGLDYLIWFELSKVKIDHIFFLVGVDGWGKDGARTSININTNLIEGQIWSDTLQYK